MVHSAQRLTFLLYVILVIQGLVLALPEILKPVPDIFRSEKHSAFDGNDYSSLALQKQESFLFGSVDG